jgi:uncharacterized Ntn-hydrolase superfamily protein
MAARSAAAHRRSPAITTFSIVACDLAARQWGVAVASKFLAAGALVSWAEAGAGAVATQAWGNPGYGSAGLALLRDGTAAADVVAALIADDPEREQRQLGVVDAAGRTEAFTGQACMEWAGHRCGPGYAVQGNLLAGPQVLDAMAEAFVAGATGAAPALVDRLLAALAAGDAAGGDRRGRQSAAVLVVEPDGGYGGLWDRLVDLRVDDHPDPVRELGRLRAIHERLFGTTPRDRWLPLEGALRDEVAGRLVRLGQHGELGRALADWAGIENLEERVDGAAAIDPVVLEALRAQSPS